MEGILWLRRLEWCDPGYDFLTPMMTEAFSTLSNVPGITLALIGFINTIHQRFEHQFKILHIVSVVVGVGSTLLHCSFKLRQQQTDEIPMVWIILVYIYTLYSPDVHWNHFKRAFKPFWFWMVKHYMNTSDRLALRLAHQYLLCFSCAIAIWGIDQKFCNRDTTLPVHPFWHALFHVLNGLNNYFGNMFLQYSRAHQLELNPQLRYVGGMLPYVKVIMKNRRTIAIQTEEEAHSKEE